MKILLTPFLFLFLMSCASHYGSISSSSINKPVKYEDVAIGVAQSSKNFFMGGLSQDALVLEARREMIKNRPLKFNEEYVNCTVDFKESVFPLRRVTKVTVSADVVRFITDSVADIYSDLYKEKVFGKTFSNALIVAGDSVFIHDKSVSTEMTDSAFFMSKKVGIVLSQSDRKIRVLYKDKHDKFYTKTISANRVYTRKKSYKGMIVGSACRYGARNTEGTMIFVGGKIVAFGFKYIMIRNVAGTIHCIKYNDVQSEQKNN
ncbi:MAG: hypothetical protein NT150_00535 [Bacteroidetes bacterium]|nr:hypothetical protein [Bacteroidota bacterium]